MRKSAQNNRSALLVAGENSLIHIQPQNKYNNFNNYSSQLLKTNQKNKNRENQLLYQSTVKQVYKRSNYPYQNNEQTYQRNRSPNQTKNKQQKYQKSPNQNIPSFYKQNNIRKEYSNNINRNQNQFQTQKQRQKNNNIGGQSYLKMNQNQSHNNKGNLYNQLQVHTKGNVGNQQILSNKKKNQDKLQIIKMKQIDQQRIKKIMMRLTFFRLRKMQALARGFLVRRKVYPKLLTQYLIAKSVLSLIQANVVYRQISTIIMQTITFPKYENSSQQMVQMYKGKQQILEDLIYDGLVTRLINKQLKPIVQQSLIQRGTLMNRPQITFGFNLRDPLQLILYEKLMSYMNKQLQALCKESINQYALDKRQLFIMDQWIEKHKMLTPLYEQIANELLEQNIGQYIVNDICNKVVREAAFAVSQSTYNKAINDWYMAVIEDVKLEVEQMVLQQAFGEALVEMGYGIQKPKQI